MSLSAKITFYEIHKCGYYKYKEKSNPCFGSIDEMLLDLNDWSKSLSFEATKTFEPDDGKILPVYLLGIKQGNDSWLLATWNQVPATEVGVSSVSRTSTLDDIKIFANTIQDNSIPGFPTYFWFFPSQKCFATVCFDVYNGKDGLQNYLENFLAFNPNHRFEYTNNSGEACYIYKESENSKNEKSKIFPSFRASIHKKPGKIKYLIQNFSKITKITRKSTVRITNTVQKASWQKALKFFNLIQPEETITTRTQDSQEFHAKVEIDAKFKTAEPLKQIISSWEKEESKTSWDDYGFSLRGEQTPIWLSHSLARDNFELTLTKNSHGLVSLDELLKELENRQEYILRVKNED